MGTEFEWLHQGTMTVSEYAIRFSKLARHAPILVFTVRERVSRFIKELDYDFKICMARELQTNIPFQQVVKISRMLERVRSEENESRETKRSRKSGGFSGFYSAAITHHGGGSSGRSAQSAIQSTHSAPVNTFSAPPERDSYSGYFSYPAQTQHEQSLPQRGYCECGDTRHIIRDCPRLERGEFHQNTWATGFISVNTPRAQPVRGEGQAGRGRP
ncbi:uncharacterized protein [Nicotiana tomentosiformis]|uniref:uncharacterized protein n=1 Tax=Nicotiana tomentosiformis TaxID=4098 RepID=UPI00388C4E02